MAVSLDHLRMLFLHKGTTPTKPSVGLDSSLRIKVMCLADVGSGFLVKQLFYILRTWQLKNIDHGIALLKALDPW